MALHITEEQVRSALSPEAAFEAVMQAHRDLAAGSADNTVRARARSSRMSLHSLSAASESIGFAAVKVYSASRSGVQSIVLLYETESGRLVATIEANELGRQRTSAASAVAAAALGGPSPCRLGLIGAGYQGWGVLEAFCRENFAFEVQSIAAYSRTASKLGDFCARAKERFSRSVLAADSAEEVCRNSDILVLATTSSQPVVAADWLDSIRGICALGSNALSRTELPARAVTAASPIVVDSVDVAKLEGGNLLAPIENGKLRWAQVAELGDLLCGRTPLPAAARFLFCSHGLAVQDLYAAHSVYTRFSA